METYGFSKGSPVWGRMALARLQTWMSGTSAGPGAPAGTRQTAVQSQEARQQEVLAQLDRTVRLFPHKLRGEGHFAALLQREGETGRPQGEAGGTLRQESEEMLPQRRDRKRRGWQDRKQVGQRNASKAVETGAFRDFASQFIRTDLVNKTKEDGGFVLQRSGDTLFLAPENLPLQGLRVLRQGLELGTVRKGRFEPSHALAMALRPEDALQVRDVTGSSREAAAYLRGESLPCEPALKGWVLVCVDGCSMGWGKASNGMLKNHYPKGLRRDVSTGE